MENYTGHFYDKLTRNNKSIKEERALEIFDDAQLKLKRNIEDLELNLKNLT